MKGVTLQEQEGVPRYWSARGLQTSSVSESFFLDTSVHGAPLWRILIRCNVSILQRKKALSPGQMKAVGPGRGRPGARTQVSGFLGQGPSL